MKSRIGVSLLLLLAAGCGHNAQYYVDAGNKLYDQKKFEDASINYRKALQKDPKAGDAYFGLGRALLAQKGKLAKAYAALTQAVQVAPQNFEAKETLANLALASYMSDPRHPKNLYDQLTNLAGQFLAHDAHSYQGLRLRGYLALSDKHNTEAIGFFRQALQAKANDAEVSLSLAQTLFQETETAEEGEKIALDTLNRHKDSSAAYDVMIGRYMATKRTAQAEALLKAKVSANPSQSAYVLQLAEYYRRSGNPTEMKATLATLLSNPKAFPQGRLQVGDYYSQIGDREQALKYFDEGARASTGDDQLTYQKRAIAVLAAIRQFDPALTAVDASLKNHPKDYDLHLVRGIVLVELRKNAPAIQELESQLKDHNDDPGLKYQLGRAKFASGQAKEGVALWQEASKLRPNYLEPRIALAANALELRNYDETLRDTDQILALAPNDLRAGLLRAVALQGLRRPAEAEVVLSELQKRNPGNRQVETEMAQLNLRQKKPAEAEKIFRALYAAAPDSESSLRGLVQSLVNEKRSDEAMRLLQADLAKTPGRPGVQFLLAEIQASSGHPDRAMEILEQLTAVHPDATQAYLVLGQLRQLGGKIDGAIDAFQKARTLAPNNAQAAILLAQAETLAGKVTQAKADYEAVIKLDPSNVLALNNLAYLEAETGDNLDEAMRLITTASQKVPAQPNLTDTLGYVYLKQKKFTNAVQLFGALAQNYPTNPTYLFHHGLALLESGSKLMAKKEFEAALAAKPNTVLATQIKAALSRAS